MGLLDSLFPGIADWQARERQKRTMTDYGLALKGVDTMSAGMIGSLLSSPSASAQRQGQSMLDAIYQGRSPEAKLQRQIGEQQLSNARDQASYARTNQQAQAQNNLYEAIKFRDYQRNLPMQEQAARNQLTIQGQQIQQNRQALLEAAKPAPAMPYGEPVKGAYPAVNPRTGQVEYIPQPNSPPWNEAQQAIRDKEDAIAALHDFLKTTEKVGATGTEYIGPLANTLRFQRGNVISKVAKARGLGVLQPGELQMLDTQLPDPTGTLRNMAGLASYLDFTGMSIDYARQSMQEPYLAFLLQLEADLEKSREQYWYVRHSPVLPKDAH